MSTPYFRFKQFTVWHDRCAMKVGTDGVLLGAWAETIAYKEDASAASPAVPHIVRRIWISAREAVWSP